MHEHRAPEVPSQSRRVSEASAAETKPDPYSGLLQEGEGEALQSSSISFPLEEASEEPMV